ncbi:MAG: hypothetical protein Fur0010_28010 [Bdellovibrio sp.]
MESAKNLRVVVVRDGDEKANMTFPIYSLNILDTLMPENVIESLSKKNICIKTIIEDVKTSNFMPQVLFDHSEENRSYRVWIE